MSQKCTIFEPELPSTNRMGFPPKVGGILYFDSYNISIQYTLILEEINMFAWPLFVGSYEPKGQQKISFIY